MDGIFGYGVTWTDDGSKGVVPNNPVSCSVSIYAANVTLGPDPGRILEKAVFDQSVVGCNIRISRILADIKDLFVSIA
jgi:hypothetical protein